MITIIIMLILAGITISLTVGENNIFKQAQKADEENQIAEYKEFINLAQTQLEIDDYKEELSDIERLEKIKQILEKDTNFDESTFHIKQYQGKNSLIIITKEGYVFVVTQEQCNYIGKDEITKLPDIKIGDITFLHTPQEYTNGNVEVTIQITKEEYKGYQIEYSYNVTDWNLYENTPIIVTQNNTTIYARITNEIASSERYAQITILNIDKQIPEITKLTQGEVNWKDGIGTVNITAKAIDTLSGIDAYQFSTNSNLTAESEGWEKIVSTKETITEQKNININNTYYFYVKDQANNINKSEIIISNIEDIRKPEISLTASRTEWTNQDVILTGKSQDMETGIIKYAWTDTSQSPSSWNSMEKTTKQIEQKISMPANGTKYFWTCDAAGNQNVASIKITNIDKQAPTANISFTGKNISGTNFTVTAKIMQQDSNSNIDFAKTKWVYNTQSSNLGDISGYTGGSFTNNTETINLTTNKIGTYYLHVLTTDQAGNQIETISSPVTIVANYHTHTGSENSGGGCYGKQNNVYHVHSGNESTGGGCYGQINNVYHKHTSSCYYTCPAYNLGGKSAWTWDHDVNLNSNDIHGCYFRCIYCGVVVGTNSPNGKHEMDCTENDYYYWNRHHIKKLTCKKNTSTVESTYYSLTCGKTTSTIERTYYSLTCGKTTETIDSYHITY